MSDPVAQLARSHSDSEHYNTLVINELTIQLLYEDLSPMADAEFEAVFGDQRTQGLTDAEGRAIIEVPPGGEQTFRLFLLSFPESYVDNASQGQRQTGSQQRWPFDILVWLLAFTFILAMGFTGVAADSRQPETVPTVAMANDNLPAVFARLTGSLYTTVGTSTITLSILLDPEHPGGTVQYGEQKPFTLRDLALTLVATSGRGLIRSARYRLRYAFNRCEHAKPAQPGAPITRWDQCYYVEGKPRPIRLEEAEVFLNRQRTPQSESFVAAGVSDFHNLSAFRISGSVKL